MSGMKNDLHVKKLLPLDKPHKGNGLELAGNFLEYPLTNTGKSERLELIGRQSATNQCRSTLTTFSCGERRGNFKSLSYSANLFFYL